MRRFATPKPDKSLEGYRIAVFEIRIYVPEAPKLKVEGPSQVALVRKSRVVLRSP
jgi:hypothetical protein